MYLSIPWVTPQMPGPLEVRLPTLEEDYFWVVTFFPVRELRDLSISYDFFLIKRFSIQKSTSAPMYLQTTCNMIVNGKSLPRQTEMFFMSLTCEPRGLKVKLILNFRKWSVFISPDMYEEKNKNQTKKSKTKHQQISDRIQSQNLLFLFHSI